VQVVVEDDSPVRRLALQNDVLLALTARHTGAARLEGANFRAIHQHPAILGSAPHRPSTLAAIPVPPDHVLDLHFAARLSNSDQLGWLLQAGVRTGLYGRSGLVEWRDGVSDRRPREPLLIPSMYRGLAIAGLEPRRVDLCLGTPP
jgi:hypothetical protein